MNSMIIDTNRDSYAGPDGTNLLKRGCVCGEIGESESSRRAGCSQK